MRLFKFVKWIWDRSDVPDRCVLVLIFFAVLPAIISSFWIGVNSGALLCVALVAIYVCLTLIFQVLSWVYSVITDHWQEFNELCPSDHERVVRKLKGQDITDD